MPLRIAQIRFCDAIDIIETTNGLPQVINAIEESITPPGDIDEGVVLCSRVSSWAHHNRDKQKSR
jgi:hypothetical protein